MGGALHKVDSSRGAQNATPLPCWLVGSRSSQKSPSRSRMVLGPAIAVGASLLAWWVQPQAPLPCECHCHSDSCSPWIDLLRSELSRCQPPPASAAAFLLFFLVGALSGAALVLVAFGWRPVWGTVLQEGAPFADVREGGEVRRRGLALNDLR